MGDDLKTAVGFFDGLDDPAWPKDVLDLRRQYVVDKRNLRGCRKCAENALKRKYLVRLRRLGWTAG